MEKNKLIIIVLVIVAALSILLYVSSSRERIDLAKQVNQVTEQSKALEIEKQNLLQELEKEKALEQKLSQANIGMKNYLRASNKRISKFFVDYEEVKARFERLGSQFSILKAEHSALLDNRNKIAKENEQLKAKVGSVFALKEAIRELKVQMHKVTVQIKEKVNLDKVIEGNRGYLIKQGKPTTPSKVKIEVVPASEK
ncbi:MAG: hypothetical protein PHO70_01865 [Candidatus Omnitrophica bacterium]|nr:hypothetical protein [Candidatus Omnitrophota bacterium]